MNKGILFIGSIFLGLMSIGIDLNIIADGSDSDVYFVGCVVLLVLGYAVQYKE